MSVITIYLIGKDLYRDHCIHHYNSITLESLVASEHSSYFLYVVRYVVVVARFFMISNFGQANLVSTEFELPTYLDLRFRLWEIQFGYV